MEVLIDGLIQGLMLSLVSVGFALVYNSTGIFHIAQGAIFSSTPFILLFCARGGLGLLASVVTSLIGAVIISLLYELVNHWPLHKKEASKEMHLIASLGSYILFVQIVVIIWGNETRVLRSEADSSLSLAGAILTSSQFTGGVASLLLISGYLYWFNRTELGLQFRALADNPVHLALLGYNIRLLRLKAFALSGLLTSIAALLMAWDIGFDPSSGLQTVLLAMVATIIGGKTSLLGPVVGAIVLGILRSEVLWYTSARWEEAITYGLLVLVLLIRPHGLLGNRESLES